MLGFFFLVFFIEAQFLLTPIREAMVLTTASGAKRPTANRLLAPLVRGTLSGFLILLLTIATASFGVLAVPAFHDRWRVESFLCANLKSVILI